MWHQVHGVQEIVAPVFANATDGVNLICYSQGMSSIICIYPAEMFGVCVFT